MRYRDLLSEKVTDHTLYHSTSYHAASLILRDDEIRALTIHAIGDRILSGVSLTRSKEFAKEWGYVTLALNGARLRQRYQIIPMNYWGHSSSIEQKIYGRKEAEEFLIGGIKNLHRYLSEIIVKNTHYLERNSYDDLLNHPLLREW